MFKWIKEFFEIWELDRERKNPPERQVMPAEIENLCMFFYEGGYYLDARQGKTNIPEDEWKYYFIYNLKYKEKTMESVKEYMYWRAHPVNSYLVSGL